MKAHEFQAEFQAIAALDLEPIKVKLMHQESGEGWTLEHANAIEFEYRRFLMLMKKFPQEQTAPLVDVDTFWHYHILDTMKYAADCEAVFGYFLHHFPYIGLRGEDDAAAHHRVGQRMRELYEATFGEAYVRDAAGADSGAAAQAAYSGAAANAAYSGAAANAAYSGAATQAAYSGAATKAAYSGAAVKAAYSGAAAKIAYSGATAANTAYSGAAQAAYSGASAVQADAAIEQAKQASFYSDRPRLALAG